MKRFLLGAIETLVLVAASGAAQSAVLTMPVAGQGTWESTLLGRDLDGDLSTAEAYYDTDLDITWLADANFARFDFPNNSNYPGSASWSNAMDWVANLDPYGSGTTDWRLPATVDGGAPGPSPEDYGRNITVHSELSHLYYVTLGNLAYDGVTNTGPFQNVVYDGTSSPINVASVYLSETRIEAAGAVWVFEFTTGGQFYDFVSDAYGQSWPVHSGDVGTDCTQAGCVTALPPPPPPPVPLPATAWLLGSGLLALGGLRRTRRV